MRDFKFFRKEVKTSIHSDTPEGYMLRRHLYHTNPEEYRRLIHSSLEDNVIEHRDNHGNREYYIQSFDNSSKIAPLKSKQQWIEILTHKSTFKRLLDEPLGVVLTAMVSAFSVIFVIGKILNVW